MKYDVIIIGGGASGLVAAIEASKQYKNVAVIEKEERLGRKILATGNGKCNLSNINAKVSDYHGSFSYAVKNLFAQFPSEYLIDYFERMGLYTFADSMGRVYPRCKQASAVLDILRNQVEMAEITKITNSKVKDVAVGETFTVTTDSGNYRCEKLIIACGGKSSPNLGSDGSMYKIIENLGHTVTRLKPALCPISVKSDIIKSIKGVRADGKLTAISKGKQIKSSYGEIQFTENSISGICAFDLSYIDFDTIHVSLMPDFTKQQIAEILRQRREIFSLNSIADFFLGMFNNKLSTAILKTAKMGSFNRKCNDISEKEINQLAKVINEFDFSVIKNSDYSKSQVTAGGVNGREINDKTFESLFIPNLYFCGEVIDIDAICGGYNLRFAFSSGIKAGQLL